MRDCKESDVAALNESHSDGMNILHNETCNICLEDFKEGESIKLLRCKHGFHDKCIKIWIVKKGKCPVCIEMYFHRVMMRILMRIMIMTNIIWKSMMMHIY